MSDETQEIKRVMEQIRDTRAEMKAKSIPRLSMMNGGHTFESLRLNEKMFALELKRDQLKGKK